MREFVLNMEPDKTCEAPKEKVEQLKEEFPYDVETSVFDESSKEVQPTKVVEPDTTSDRVITARRRSDVEQRNMFKSTAVKYCVNENVTCFKK